MPDMVPPIDGDDGASDTDRRVTELEVRVAYQERLLGELDGVVRDLGDELLRTRHVLARAMTRLDAALDDSGPVEGEVD